MFGVVHLQVMGFDVLERIHDQTLELMDVFFGSGFGHGWGL